MDEARRKFHDSKLDVKARVIRGLGLEFQPSMNRYRYGSILISTEALTFGPVQTMYQVIESQVPEELRAEEMQKLEECLESALKDRPISTVFDALKRGGG